MKRFSLPAFLPVLLFAAPVMAQAGGVSSHSLPLEESVEPIVLGRVISAVDGAPLGEALVFWVGESRGVKSNPYGIFRLATGAKSGELWIGLNDYEEQRLDLEVAKGTFTEVLVALRPSPGSRSTPPIRPPEE